MKRFDRTFGAERIAQLPTSPGVYLFKDDDGAVLYVGKAANLRRRLSSYRNASRKKVHRKMRMLVREASQLEIRVQPSEREALAVENELIRSFEPPHNVEGAFSFLYPAIGLRWSERRTLLCFTTSTPVWDVFEFTWFGHFRSRLRAKQAFDTLIDLLALVGHLERRSSLDPAPSLRGSRLAGVRQLDSQLVAALGGYLAGESLDGLKQLVLALLEKPLARRESVDVQQMVELLESFYASDLRPLHDALRSEGRSGTFVEQRERDVLFIRSQ
ncbi:MAG: nucleotide excision repair endonuclease [bacterium]|nr:nucleotide excision repair endonuclease [bacterium]